MLLCLRSCCSSQRRAFLLFVLLFAILLAGVAAPVLAGPGLTLEAAQRLAQSPKLAAGEASIAAARAALALLREHASAAGQRVRRARIGLSRWVGAAPELAELVELADLGDLGELGDLPDLAHVRLHAASIGSQLGHHPQIALLEREKGVARAQVRLAEANRQPDWSVEVAFQQRGAAYANMLSVGLSIPLQRERARRQDRELAARIAQADGAMAERDDALRAHVAEAQAMLGDWLSRRERLARYRAGKSSLPEVLAAHRGEIDVKLQAIELDADAAMLWAQLNYLGRGRPPEQGNGGIAMKRRATLMSLGAVALMPALAAGFGSYRLGLARGKAVAGLTSPAPAAVAKVPAEKKVLYWHDPMVPGQRFDQPGKSPFMDMQPVPVYASEDESCKGMASVNVSARMQQSLGVRTARVTSGSLAASLQAVVMVENAHKHIEAWHRAHADRPGQLLQGEAHWRVIGEAAIESGRRIHAAAGRRRPAVHAAGAARHQRRQGRRTAAADRAHDQVGAGSGEHVRQGRRAETAIDPAPLEMFEAIVAFKPREQWRAGMTPQRLVEELDKAAASGWSGCWATTCWSPAQSASSRWPGCRPSSG